MKLADYCEATPQPTDFPTPSPTDSPTSSPTDSPTMSPTDSPTSSPTDSPAPTPSPSASAIDDPHLTNMRGESFDLWRLGQVEFLRVPFDATKGSADFTLTARVSNVTSD